MKGIFYATLDSDTTLIRVITESADAETSWSNFPSAGTISEQQVDLIWKTFYDTESATDDREAVQVDAARTERSDEAEERDAVLHGDRGGVAHAARQGHARYHVGFEHLTRPKSFHLRSDLG